MSAKDKKSEVFSYFKKVKGARSHTVSFTGVGNGGAGGTSAPPKFWFGKNPGKISENLHELPENMSKNGAQHALIWKKWRPKWHEELFFGGHFFWSFFQVSLGEFGQKSFHSQNLPAPTPTVSLNKGVFKHIFAFVLMQMCTCLKEHMREVIDCVLRSLHGLPGQRC